MSLVKSCILTYTYFISLENRDIGNVLISSFAYIITWYNASSDEWKGTCTISYSTIYLLYYPTL